MVKKTLKIGALSVELILDEKIFYYAVFGSDGMQHSPGTI